MANSEHLTKLSEGVEAWNDWRMANPRVVPELFKAKLFSADLRGANLVKAILVKANLGEANLVDTDLRGANLRGANLRGANLRGTELAEADLTGANLVTAILVKAILVKANLGEANLRGANFVQADLVDADLRGAIFTGAILVGANLRGANLSDAELAEAILVGTNLREAKLTKASIAYTIFARNDLSDVKDLESVVHFAPSTIGIDTIYRSDGNIPDAFLRGAGVPDIFIKYMRSLTGKALEFCSCFISYSTKDQDFADRLYADLQNKGVRCWFAPHDLKIGDRFQEVIEQNIRVYEKLLIILSGNSVNSPWVEREVQAATEKEGRRRGDTVLFPIRLDDAVMDSDRAWAADIRRTRHIGDFRNWKDRDSSKSAFERLLRDLKAEGPNVPLA